MIAAMPEGSNPFIEEMWMGVKQEGEQTQKTGKDSWLAWDSLRTRLLELNNGVNWAIKWKPEAHTYYQTLVEMGLEDYAGYEKYDQNDKDRLPSNRYCVLQLGEIVHKTPHGNFIQLMKIAFNIGQARVASETSPDMYNKEVLEFLSRHADIHSYVDLIAQEQEQKLEPNRKPFNDECFYVTIKVPDSNPDSLLCRFYVCTCTYKGEVGKYYGCGWSGPHCSSCSNMKAYYDEQYVRGRVPRDAVIKTSGGRRLPEIYFVSQ